MNIYSRKANKIFTFTYKYKTKKHHIFLNAFKNLFEDIASKSQTHLSKGKKPSLLFADWNKETDQSIYIQFTQETEIIPLLFHM